MEDLMSQLEKEVREALRKGDLASAAEALSAFLELMGEIPDVFSSRLAEIQKEIAAAEIMSVQMRVARHEHRKRIMGMSEE